MSLDHLRAYYKVPSAPQAPARAASAPARALPHLPAGTWIERHGRSIYLVEESWARHERHGFHVLGALGAVKSPALRVLTGDVALGEVDLERALFLDTETTGLGGGSGTYVFLVGCAYLDGDRFRLRQFFLPGPADEGAFLAELESFLAAFDVLVTFNGRSFDWPLLQGRYHLQRRPPPAIATHLDLLHSARRLWRDRLPGCSLRELEQHTLGVTRESDDVPGWQIPELYFRYQRTGDDRPLARVFYHNRVDLLSLAALALLMTDAVADPLSGRHDHASDLLALARMHDRVGNTAMAVRCFERAELLCHTEALRADILTRLGAVYKRRGQWDDAVGVWSKLIAMGGEAGMAALVEMAKYCEHVLHDYDRGLALVQRGLDMAELRRTMSSDADIRALRHRFERLLARRSRLEAVGAR